ncbi:MAG: phosphate ABC transporter permease PstA [Hyphomonadaceae bacterium]|nr:phosphate ABC transporter permease PstA [Clostridia bacterium]
MKILIGLSTILTIGALLWIVTYVAVRGFSGFDSTFWEEISPMIVTTLLMIFLSLVISVPIGIAAAIYLNEYAKNGKIMEVIRFSIETLSGIPSIIYGLFGMIFFVTFLKMGFSILAGTLTLCIMVLPTVIRTTEESLKSVQASFREGSFALGATKLRTVLRVVVPSAISGIMTAVVLSVGRIVGETAAVYLTAGTVARMPSSFTDSGRTLSVHLFILAKEAISFEKAFATATVLIVMILIINLIANFIGARGEAK